jgi:hypothetical protein
MGAIAGAAGAVISWWAYKESHQASKEAHEASQNTKIKSNVDSLQEHVNKISAGNISNSSLQQNNLFFLEAEKLSKDILSDLENSQIQDKYNNMAAINLLYLINAISNQYLYNNTLPNKSKRLPDKRRRYNKKEVTSFRTRVKIRRITYRPKISGTKWISKSSGDLYQYNIFAGQNLHIRRK